ncbi:MAG: GntR family transcriptional regulator [Rubrimonas sp.]|uniref:GntR family transcriptional regulator n=1 Tax=Rubrimonas sp. TaxID=2036015 RepID=UPI002FDD2AE6
MSLPGHAKETAVEMLVRRLSAGIVEGALAPGVRLDEQSLAERFEVSRTPVREALAQLAAQGLVERRPHRGVVVAGLSMERLLHLFELMTELEGVCARLAALRMTDAERAALAADHLAARALAEAEDSERYADANRLFHLAIYDGAHNPELVGTTRDVRNRLAPFRRAQFQVHGRPSASWREHDAVAQAILARDGEAASAAMRAHIEKVKDAYRAFAHLDGLPDRAPS